MVTCRYTSGYLILNSVYIYNAGVQVITPSLIRMVYPKACLSTHVSKQTFEKQIITLHVINEAVYTLYQRLWLVSNCYDVRNIGTLQPMMPKIYLLCFRATLKNEANYAQHYAINMMISKVVLDYNIVVTALLEYVDLVAAKHVSPPNNPWIQLLYTFLAAIIWIWGD